MACLPIATYRCARLAGLFLVASLFTAAIVALAAAAVLMFFVHAHCLVKRQKKECQFDLAIEQAIANHRKFYLRNLLLAETVILSPKSGASMIRLEYFTKDDFQQLIDWVDNEHLLTNWAGSLFSFPLTPDSLDWYLEDTNDLAKAGAFVYKAVDDQNGKVVGHISLGGISRKNRSARISRVLVGDPEYAGKGVCSAMVKEVIAIGFGELALHRISLGVYDFNTAAIRCYERCGFVREGVQRDVLKYGDAFWSLLEMSILEEEWRKMNEAH